MQYWIQAGVKNGQGGRDYSVIPDLGTAEPWRGEMDAAHETTKYLAARAPKDDVFGVVNGPIPEDKPLYDMTRLGERPLPMPKEEDA